MIKLNASNHLNDPPKKNRNVALQVHNRPSVISFPGERTVPRRRLANGSLTVEASLALPLFLFAMYLLILPMRMMDSARRMQEICEEICRDAAEGSYLLHLKDEKPSAHASLPSYLSEHTLSNLAVAMAKHEIKDSDIQNLHAVKTYHPDDPQLIILKMEYDYRLPFSVIGMQSVHQTVQASRRAWVGASLKENDTGDSEEDETVYIGQNSTRYHSSLHCHYLSNDLTEVSFAHISEKRNSGGGTYHACPRCATSVSGGLVYIMPSGTAYHADPSCSAICSYARAVKKSMVAHLGPCHHCCTE